MVPTPPAERTLQATGARRRVAGEPPTPELLMRLRAMNEGESAFVAIFDARAIGGERHLLSAWAHLGRARARGEFRLRDRSAEFSLYVAGDDQLPRALAKVGIDATTEEFVVVAERPRSLEEALRAFDLRADPSVYPRPPTVALLDRLGVNEAERSVLPSSAWEGLVLERVALVDLAPAKGAPAPPKKG